MLDYLLLTPLGNMLSEGGMLICPNGAYDCIE